MLLEGDATSMEWRCAAFLSQDHVMIQEIVDGLDPHQYTLDHYFKGKGTRTNAKVLNFGLIYGRNHYGFMKDATMPKFSKKQWIEIIGMFYSRYSRLQEWQNKNIQEVNSKGYLVNPTGRILRFGKVEKWDGGEGYHEPAIKNYPVQSFATADLMPLVLVQVNRKVREEKIKADFVMQIHDSLLFDVAKGYERRLAEIIDHYFKSLPETCKKVWGFTLNVPMDSEIKVGSTWGEMKVYTDHLMNKEAA